MSILYDNGIGTLKITYKNNISHEYDRGVCSAETVIAAIIEGYIHRTLNPQMWKAMQRTKLCNKIEIQSDLWTMVSPKPGEEIHQTLSIARNGEVNFLVTCGRKSMMESLI